jgi:hypothetical protein
MPRTCIHVANEVFENAQLPDMIHHHSLVSEKEAEGDANLHAQ